MLDLTRLLSRLGIALLTSPLLAAQGPTATTGVPGRAALPFDPGTFATQLGLTTFPGGESTSSDQVSCSVRLPSGAVVIAGSTNSSLGEPNAGQTDAFVARISRQGVLQWVVQIGALTAPTIPALNGQPGGPGGDASDYDSVGSMILDDDGTLLITGSTFTSLAETNTAYGSDLFVARLTVQGQLLWLRQVGAETTATIAPAPGATVWGDSAGSDYGTELLVDPAGGFWVAGFTGSSLSEKILTTLGVFLAHFDDSGVLDGFQQVGEIHAPLLGPGWDSGSHRTEGLVLTPTGPMVGVIMESFSGGAFSSAGSLLQWDGQGIPVSAVPIPPALNQVGDLAVDSAGRVFVAGTFFEFISFSEYAYDAAAACFDPITGQWCWSTRLDASLGASLGLMDLTQDEYGRAIALDAAGNLVVAGTTSGSLDEPNAGINDLFAMRLAARDGTLLSVRQLGATSAAESGRDFSGNELVRGLAVDADGRIDLAGSTTGDLAEPNAGFSHDALLLRLSPSLRWD